jgi:hypothetical protein
MRIGELAAAAGANAETLHVTNGDSTGDTLRQTALNGVVLTWRDMLPEGPLATLPAPELRRARAAFLSDCGWGEADAIAAELEERDRTLAEALAAGHRIVLWFEQDLLDQLQLLQALAAIAEWARSGGAGSGARSGSAASGARSGSAASGARVELIVVGDVDGHPEFRGLGELDAAELEALWPRRAPLTAEVEQLAARAWHAVCAPQPAAMADLIAGDTSALPLLAPALRRWLDELPDTEAGLALSERRILTALAEGPRTAVELFLTSLDGERLLLNGDTWFWRQLATLGTGPQRLLEPLGGGELPEPSPRSGEPAFGGQSLALTETGRRVLAGDGDRVALLGLDRWVGGAHLTPANAWRRDPTGRVVAP